MFRLIFVLLAITASAFWVLPAEVFWLVMSALAIMASLSILAAVGLCLWSMAPWKKLKKSPVRGTPTLQGFSRKQN